MCNSKHIILCLFYVSIRYLGGKSSRRLNWLCYHFRTSSFSIQHILAWDYRFLMQSKQQDNSLSCTTVFANSGKLIHWCLWPFLPSFLPSFLPPYLLPSSLREKDHSFAGDQSFAVLKPLPTKFLLATISHYWIAESEGGGQDLLS